MAKWQIMIAGRTAHLRLLPELIDSFSMKVSCQKNEDGRDEYLLESPRFDQESDKVLVREIAEEFIGIINGIGKLYIDNYENSSIWHAAYVIREDGSREFHWLFGNEQDRGPNDFVTVNKQLLDTVSASSLIEVALRNTEIVKAFKFYCEPDTWSNLAKVFEIIAKSSGGEKAIVSKGWTSKSFVDDFGRTANNYAVGGLDARHAVSYPNLATMTPIDKSYAKEQIRNALLKWIESRAVAKYADEKPDPTN